MSANPQNSAARPPPAYLYSCCLCSLRLVFSADREITGLTLAGIVRDRNILRRGKSVCHPPPPRLLPTVCNSMTTSTPLPTPKVIQVDTRGAVILGEESPEVSCPLNSPSATFSPSPSPCHPHLDPAHRLSPSQSTLIRTSRRETAGEFICRITLSPCHISPLT